MFKHTISIVTFLSLFGSNYSAFSAIPVKLDHLNPAMLQSLQGRKTDITEVNRSLDFNHTLHIRLQQLYAGYPVMGGEAVLHIKQANDVKRSLNNIMSASNASQTTMNGTEYLQIETDLVNSPAVIFTPEQAIAAQNAITQWLYAKNAIKQSPIHNKAELIVYIDANKKAHWAFQVATVFDLNHKLFSPIYIVDALTFNVFESWDNTQSFDAVEAGGLGGNKRYPLFYDGQNSHAGKLSIQRNAGTHICYLKNNDATVIDFNKVGAYGNIPAKINDKTVIAQFVCQAKSNDHDNLYWNANFDESNDGFSPSNDALYAGQVVQQMYQNWYGVPMLRKEDGTPMQLNLFTHILDRNEDPTYPQVDPNVPFHPYENAFWSNYFQAIFLGEGSVLRSFPFTSLDIVAHEVSHGFTAQHSQLIYKQQSGALNESFSDMAAQAAEYFAHGKSPWTICETVRKVDGTYIRHMDNPKLDGYSIINVKDYNDKLDVHYTSGVFNYFFYNLSNTPDWNPKKAFALMLQANSNYWTPSSTFAEAMCGTVKAANDLQYDQIAIAKAFAIIGLDVKTCDD